MFVKALWNQTAGLVKNTSSPCVETAFSTHVSSFTRYSAMSHSVDCSVIPSGRDMGTAQEPSGGCLSDDYVLHAGDGHHPATTEAEMLPLAATGMGLEKIALKK